MIEPRSRDSRLKKMLANFRDWLCVRDYAQATAEATRRIVRKQSRGSVNAQNGWYMTTRDLRDLSRRADLSMRELSEMMKK